MAESYKTKDGRVHKANPFSSRSAATIAVNSNGNRLTQKQMAKVLSSEGSISSLNDREVQKQLQRGISRFESVLGVRERNIKVADLPGAYGVTFLGKNGSQGIYLNRSAFSGNRKEVENKYKKDNYDTGFKNKTNRAIQHTVTHELAHSLWASNYDTPKHKAAGAEIRELYKKWSSKSNRKGWGKYARENADEFFAEAVTKGIHGNKDYFSKRAIEIAKKHKL